MQTKLRLDGKTIFEGDQPEMQSDPFGTGPLVWHEGNAYRVRHVNNFVQNGETSQEVQLSPAM
jgi:hypothetical protein